MCFTHRSQAWMMVPAVQRHVVLSLSRTDALAWLAAPAVTGWGLLWLRPQCCWCWLALPVTQTAGWCAALVAWLLGNTCHTECSCLRQIRADSSKARSLSCASSKALIAISGFVGARGTKGASIDPYVYSIVSVYLHYSILILIRAHFVGYFKSKLAMPKINLWINDVF